MSIVNRPHSYTPNTTISSSQANANENTLYNDYNGNISAANLATDAVTTAKIADSNVTTAKIADANVTTAKIADTNVTNAKLATGAGEPGGAWDSWTPTLANLSGGTMVAKYKQIGKTIHFYWKYTLAGAGVGTAPTFTLPVTAIAAYGTGAVTVFTGSIYDDNTGNGFQLLPYLTSTTVCTLGLSATGGTYASIGGVTASAPITFAANDILFVAGTYEAA